MNYAGALTVGTTDKGFVHRIGNLPYKVLPIAIFIVWILIAAAVIDHVYS